MDGELGKRRPLSREIRRQAVGRPLGEPRRDFAPGIRQSNEFAMTNFLEGPIEDGFKFAETVDPETNSTVPMLYVPTGQPRTRSLAEIIVVDRGKDGRLRRLIEKAEGVVRKLHKDYPSVEQERIAFELCKLVATAMDHQRAPFVSHPGTTNLREALGQSSVLLGEATIDTNLASSCRHRALAAQELFTYPGKLYRSKLRRGIIHHPASKTSGLHMWIELPIGHGPEEKIVPIDFNITPGGIDFRNANFEAFKQYGGFSPAVFDRFFHNDQYQYFTPHGEYLYSVGFRNFGRRTMVRPGK